LRRAAADGAASTQRAGSAGGTGAGGVRSAPCRARPALTRQARRRAAERVFVIGDAAGYVEPFTGEGMAWALASGAAVVPLAAAEWRPELMREWAARYRDVVSRRQAACRAAAAVLRHPLLTAAPVAVLARVPPPAR